MMLIMAGGATGDGRVRMQRDRCRVTLHARDVRVRFVLERDGPLARRMLRHRDRDRLLVRRRNLGGAMTGGALALRRFLVMARETAARRREREALVWIRGRVTRDAGELFVTVMRERIRGSGDEERGTRSGAWWVRVALSLEIGLPGIEE
jgi:hypothetical protein